VICLSICNEELGAICVGASIRHRNFGVENKECVSPTLPVYTGETEKEKQINTNVFLVHYESGYQQTHPESAFHILTDLLFRYPSGLRLHVHSHEKTASHWTLHFASRIEVYDDAVPWTMKPLMFR
jgi:hypothetical protein